MNPLSLEIFFSIIGTLSGFEDLHLVILPVRHLAVDVTDDCGWGLDHQRTEDPVTVHKACEAALA